MLNYRRQLSNTFDLFVIIHLYQMLTHSCTAIEKAVEVILCAVVCEVVLGKHLVIFSKRY